MKSAMALTAALTLICLSVEAQTIAPEVLLKSAMQRESIDGDDTAALLEYHALVRQYPDHPLAPRALMQAAGIYDRMALRARARDCYEQVVAHPRAGNLKAEATARLAAMTPTVKGTQQPTQRAVVTGNEANFVWSRVSPDGRYLPFGHPTGHLAIRDLQSGATALVTTAKDGDGLVEAAVWSPDMRELAYSWWDESGEQSRMQLRVIAREKGTAKILYAPPPLAWLEPQAWSPDGRNILLIVDEGDRRTLALISVATGALREIKTAHRPVQALFSPDGKHIAYEHEVAGLPMRDITTVAVDGSTERALVASPDHDYLLGWSPDGFVLFGSDRMHAMGAWALAVSNGAPQGQAALVKADIGRSSGLGFDRSGRFYSVVSVGGMDVFLAEIDRASGKVKQQAVRAPRGQPLARRGQAAWSSDGGRIVYTQTIPGRGTSIVEHALATADLTTRLVPFENIERLSWFPDGRTIALEANAPEGRQVFKFDLRDGASAPLGPAGQNFWGLYPDGRAYIYSGARDGKPAVLRRDLATGSEEVLRAGRSAAAISSDGGSVAFWYQDGKAASISVKSQGSAERVLISGVPRSVNRIAWSPDGGHVYYIANNREIWRVAVATGDAIDTGVRMALAKRISVSPDGTRLALTGGAASAEVYVWENLRRPAIK